MSYSASACVILLFVHSLLSEWQRKVASRFEHCLMLCVCTERDTTTFNPNTHLLTCLALKLNHNRYSLIH